MKKFSFILLLLTTYSFAEAPKENLTSTMRKNFEALMNLQGFAADAKSFQDPDNRDEIQKNLDAMSDLKHVFATKANETEPGLAAISNLFNEYLENTQKSFKAGANGSYIRNQIRTMTGFCLSCHTRISSNFNFQDIHNKIEKSNKLNEFQKAEFYAATRQFDKAIPALEKILTASKLDEMDLFDFSRGTRDFLNIAIRVKQDPKLAFNLLDKLTKRKDLPEFFQRHLKEWKNDISGWMMEKDHPKKMDYDLAISKASTLVAKARKKQLFAVDPVGDVLYLRATNYIHEALQKDPKNKHRGEALYLLGICYDSLQDPLLWALDSLYFEACVRENPHTAVAKKCYQRYASKLYFGYSGSGGTAIPEDEIKKLTELRKIAE